MSIENSAAHVWTCRLAPRQLRREHSPLAADRSVATGYSRALVRGNPGFPNSVFSSLGRAMKTKREQLGPLVPRDLRRLCPKGDVPLHLLRYRLPPLFPGTTLGELNLPCRARKFLQRRKYLERPRAVAKLTVGDLAKVRGLGTRSIIDLVEALYRCAQRRGFEPRQGADEALARPATMELAPRNLRRKLPRKGIVLPELLAWRLPPIPPGATLADLRLTGRALRFFQEGQYLENPEALAELTVGDLLAQHGVWLETAATIVEALYRSAEPRPDETTLEEEVLRWLVPKGQPLRREIVAQRFGFGGRTTSTLAALGASYGYTRERIRQFCTPRSAAPSSALRRFQAALDAASSSLPTPAAVIEARLVSEGLMQRGTKLESLVQISRLFERDAGFVLAGNGPNCLATPPLTDETARLAELLMRLSNGSPVLQTAQVLARWNAAEQTPLDIAAVEQTIKSMPCVRWLDRTSGWFWVDRPRTALRLRVEKALAAAGSLTIAELEAAVWRGPKTRGWRRLPLTVFRELCGQLPECRTRGDFVSAAAPRGAQSRLRGGERKLVEFLQHRGGACPLKELKLFSKSEGISEEMLWQLLSGSPAVKRYGREAYGVPGL